MSYFLDDGAKPRSEQYIPPEETEDELFNRCTKSGRLDVLILNTCRPGFESRLIDFFSKKLIFELGIFLLLSL